MEYRRSLDRFLRNQANERVQAEIRIANEITQQHPDISRDDALRAAYNIAEK